MGSPLANPFDSLRFLWASRPSLHPCVRLPFSGPGPGVYETQGRHSVVGNFSGKGGALAVGTRGRPRCLFHLPRPLVPWCHLETSRDTETVRVAARFLRPTHAPVLCRSPVWATCCREQVGLGEPCQQPLHGGSHARVRGCAPHRLHPGAQARP